MVDLSVLSVVAPAILTGLTGWIVAKHTSRSNERLASVKRADEDRKERIDNERSHAGDLTGRFKVLMDGYEGRISELTAEVHNLRIRIDELSIQLKRCSSCPYFRGHDGTD